MFQKRTGKKGQFFLISAVIIIMALFTIVAKYNTIREQIALEDFKELSEGYNSESPKVINSALFTGENPQTDLQSFTTDYNNYARQQEPTFGILYAYRDEHDVVHIVNTLTNAVLNIEFNDPETGRKVQFSLPCDVGPNCEAPGSITVNVGGIPYSTTLHSSESAYSGQFSNVKTLEGIDSLTITYPDGSLEEISLANFRAKQTVDESLPDGSLIRRAFTTELTP